MAKSKSTKAIETVEDYIQNLGKSLADLVESIRKVILAADNKVGEEIKWNSPSFFYTGEMKPFDPKEYKRDIVVLNLRQKDHVLLVFPTGAKVKDTAGILEGAYTDGRRLVKISNTEDLKAKEKNLKKVIKEWLKLIDK